MKKHATALWLEVIVAQSDRAIIVLDKKRVIQFANLRAAQMAGAKKPEDILNKSYDSYLQAWTIKDKHGRLLTPQSSPTHKAFEKGVETRDMLIEQSSGNKHYWLCVSCIPLKNANNVIEHAIVYYKDISLQKFNEDKLEFLVENSKILSLTNDFKTRLTEKARHTVPNLADWCTVNIVNIDNTLTRIAIVHRDPSKIKMVEELANASSKNVSSGAGIYQVLRSGKAQFNPKISFRSMTSGPAAKLAKDLQVCSSMIIPIKSEGITLGVLSLAYAESGRHYTKEDLEFFEDFCHHLGVLFHNARLFEEIREKDRAKDAFLATLSHELRNPLAPIKSSLELLAIKNSDARFNEELSLIEHQFTHLTNLLLDLLDVTRYSQGKIVLTKKPIDVISFIKRIVDTYIPHSKAKHITFLTNLPDTEIILDIDEIRFEQAIRNILHNALKFTPQGGSVSINVAVAEDAVSIEIQDTGEGIPSEHLPYIFAGSQNYIAPTRNPQSGLGIGLVLVKEILRLHSGEVSAKSEGSGLGSVFTIQLPIGSSTEGTQI